MENIDLSSQAGLIALAFWGFVAAVAVASIVTNIWNGIRKRETQHETIRRVIESGQEIDMKVINQLLSNGEDSNPNLARDFRITALWILPAAVGVGIFGLILGSSVPDARAPMLGASALIACIGIGALMGAKMMERWYGADDSSELK